MKTKLHINIIIAVIFGILAGFFLDNLIHIYTFLGNTFITVLKYIVVPLVFASLITGILSLGGLNNLQQIGFKTLIYFILTTGIASILGILLTLLINPGKGFIYKKAVDVTLIKGITFKTLLTQIIPSNFFEFISGGNMLFVILISIIIGIVLISFGKQISFPINELFEGLNEFMTVITTFIITLSPIGIFGLIAKLVVETGIESFLPVLKFILVVFIGLLIHACIILPTILKIIIKCSPIAVAKDMFTSLATGFSTASSSATLPILMDDVKKKLKVPNKISSFVLPLGITINMDGTALFQSVATIFIAQIFGVELSTISFAIIIIMAIISSIGAAAIPSAGLITLAMILTTLGIPIEGIAIIIGVDRFLDMTRTTINLWGNSIACLIITKWAGESAYDI